MTGRKATRPRLTTADLLVAVLAVLAPLGPAAAQPPVDGAGRQQAVARLTRDLLSDDARLRRRAAEQLATFGPAARPALLPLETALKQCGGETDDHWVGACLTAIRAMGPVAEDAAATLASLLRQQSPLFDGRDKLEVIRLRAYLLVTLADIGAARVALPHIVDSLANVDDYSRACEAGAAVRAAASMGPAARPLVDHLLPLFHRQLTEPDFSLERYDPSYPLAEGTTVPLEIVRALERIRPVGHGPARRLLVDCAVPGSLPAGRDRRIAAAALSALQSWDLPAPRKRQAGGELSLADQFRIVPAVPAGPALRKALTAEFLDQDGNHGRLGELIDRPTALIFFYTRCTNTQKCSAAVSRISDLQRQLKSSGIRQRVRLIGVTYEPKHDGPKQLRNYGHGRGVEFDETTRFVRLDPRRHAEVIQAFDVPVSYNTGWVNVHGVALYVLDGRGQIRRLHHTLLWSSESVADDLKGLLALDSGG